MSEQYERKPLILKSKVEAMLPYMEERLKNFPRDQRSGVTPCIRKAGYSMLTIAADIGNGYYNLTNVNAFDRQKNTMTALIDYALSQRFLSAHQHKVWGGMLTEIGRINGGLKKALPMKR